MKDELKAAYFRELIGFESFAAQLALEEETYNSLLNRLLTLDLNSPTTAIEYAKLRGSLDILKSLKTKREHFVEMARSRS